MRHEDLAAVCMMVLSPFSLAGVFPQSSGKQAPRGNRKPKGYGKLGGGAGMGGAPEPLGTPELGMEGGSQEDWPGRASDCHP